MGPIFLSALRLPEIVRSTERRSPGDANSIEMSPVVSGNGSSKSLAGDQPHNWLEPRASVRDAAPQTNFSVLVCMCWLLEPKVAIVLPLCYRCACDLMKVSRRQACRSSGIQCAVLLDVLRRLPQSWPAFGEDPSRTGATAREGSRRTCGETELKASMSMLR